jgi:NhaP-type Na+/H+ or K+/H+ antiporter
MCSGPLSVAWRWGGCAVLVSPRIVVLLRRRKGFAVGMESFLALGLIALTYGVAIHAAVYGFLAVFVAGLGMRDVEHGSKANVAIAASEGTASEAAVLKKDVEAAAEVSNLAMDFVEDLEKFAEMAAMLVIGSLLTMDLFTWRNNGLVACLLFIVRPLAVFATMAFASWNGQQKRIGAWLGIRGVGSLYYLAFVLTHGLLAQSRAAEIVQVVLLTIAASVVLHGVSSTPLMDLYKRRCNRRPDAAS